MVEHFEKQGYRVGGDRDEDGIEEEISWRWALGSLRS